MVCCVQGSGRNEEIVRIVQRTSEIKIMNHGLYK